MKNLLIILTILIFSIGFISGFIFINDFSKNYKGEKINQKLDIKFNFPFILTNNLKVIFLMLAGSITFGLSTFINLIYNGFNVGVLIGSTFQTNEPLKLILALILPHGIFEIPALLISAVAGFKIPYEITLYLLDKKEKPITEEDIKEFLKLALISIILIIIAAFVEVYITPKVANYLLT
ncbi:stage II sporulation protein M [Methanocaldococcus sp.]|uniref:stage II sporulation protein M n=1 Tax=Methanocaldococcus sp. TaxID=2152917 RepID=UPI00262AED06|nr:stage II sporulation protein M [Methanocaldococcus sp.]MCQ6253350.1 stage II sporulation protein M [Methanocaldococcus sp.]